MTRTFLETSELESAMTFWRFMGFIGCCLLIGGGVTHKHPGYFVAVMLICGSIGGVGGLIGFFVRRR